ncbi:hypothetical protein V5O48_016593 [Marasmius crinis-equi]|uniref:FAD-binding PCMH-type domain-containing protein n=1 Tax=Marasmius crinis-equi TaxID=585013 RepID=A0ABR3ERA5_9AGAR
MGNSPSAPAAFESCVRSALPASAISVPTDLLYHTTAVKPYNLAYDITPIAVVRPSTTEEVSKVVKCASDSGIKVQPRSGGHSYGDYSIGGQDGSFVIDLVHFQKFEYDRSTGQATIGSGTLLGDLTNRLQNVGRAMAYGLCPQVGIGGHATIGGLGPLSRQWGSMLDQVVEAQVVLANGTVVRTSTSQSPELFFCRLKAVKGAAASFGVVTEFKVNTHPQPNEVTQYTYKIEVGSHRELAGYFQTWQAFISQPDLSRKFASQFIAYELGLIIQGAYYGPRSEFDALKFDERVTSNKSALSVTVSDWLGSVVAFAAQEAINLVGALDVSFYSKSLAIQDDTLMSNGTIQSLFNLFDTADKGSLAWFVIFDLAGGATNDVPLDATSYPHRNVLYFLQSYIVGIPFITNTSRNFLNDINGVVESGMPNANLGAYAGYVDPFLADSQSKYWGSNYPRLRKIKREVDPGDTFRNPQSVAPA